MTDEPMAKPQIVVAVGICERAGVDQWIAAQLRESAQVKLALLEAETGTIARIAEALIQAFRNGGKVLLFGNGGSAADAQHIAAELAGKFRLHRTPLPALALTTNTSILTAIANDYDYAQVFARQVEAWTQPADVIIGISTSGNSPNVLEGLRAARARGATTIGLTGRHGQTMAHLTDLCLLVPSDDTARIQEVHITVGHILCDIIERELSG